MALVYCPACGTQVSDTALQCPHCGHVLPRTSSLAKMPVITVCTFLGIICTILGFITSFFIIGIPILVLGIGLLIFAYKQYKKLK